jgi:hypothetical protein
VKAAQVDKHSLPGQFCEVLELVILSASVIFFASELAEEQDLPGDASLFLMLFCGLVTPWHSGRFS